MISRSVSAGIPVVAEPECPVAPLILVHGIAWIWLVEWALCGGDAWGLERGAGSSPLWSLIHPCRSPHAPPHRIPAPRPESAGRR